jgi:hypothetical protein
LEFDRVIIAEPGQQQQSPRDGNWLEFDRGIIAEPGQQQQSPREGTWLEFDRGIDVEPVCWGLGWSSIE